MTGERALRGTELAGLARVAEGAPASEGGRGGEGARASDPVVELCAFRVGSEEYAIDLRRIREILQLLPVTPVPHAPAFVEGVVSLRGEVVPVIDLRKRLGMARQGGGALPATPVTGGRPKVMVVNVGGRVFGLLVDAVREVVRIRRSQIRPPPLLEGAGPHLFLGICGGREGAPGASGRERQPGDGGREGQPRAGGRQGSSPGRGQLRLLLNVKALFAPVLPADEPPAP